MPAKKNAEAKLVCTGCEKFASKTSFKFCPVCQRDLCEWCRNFNGGGLLTPICLGCFPDKRPAKRKVICTFWMFLQSVIYTNSPPFRKIQRENTANYKILAAL